MRPDVLVFLIPFLIISIVNCLPIVIAYFRKAKYRKMLLRFFGLNEILIGIWLYFYLVLAEKCLLYCKVEFEKQCVCPYSYDLYLLPLFITILIILVVSFIFSFVRIKKK